MPNVRQVVLVAGPPESALMADAVARADFPPCMLCSATLSACPDLSFMAASWAA